MAVKCHGRVDTNMWHSDYQYTHHSPLVLPRLSLYTSQSPWCYSDYPFAHQILLVGTQTIPIHITVSLVELRLSLYSTKSVLWYSDYPYTHHSLHGGTQAIPIHIIDFLVVLRLSLYTSESPLWSSHYPYTHHYLTLESRNFVSV